MREAARRNIWILTGSSLWSEEQRLYRRGRGVGGGGWGGCTLMRFCLGLGDSADNAVQEPEVLRAKERKENGHVSQAWMCVCVCVRLLSDLPGLPDTSSPSRRRCRRPATSRRWQVWLLGKGRSEGENERRSQERWRAIRGAAVEAWITEKAWFHLTGLFYRFFSGPAEVLESWECVKHTCTHSWSASAGHRRRTLGPWGAQVRGDAEWWTRAKCPQLLCPLGYLLSALT